MGEKHLRYDILGKLPIELVQEITSYLPLSESFRAMRVCHDWFDVLTSPLIVQSQVRFWFPKAETLLRIPDHLSAKAVATLKAEHIDAFRNGRPFSRLHVNWQSRRDATSAHWAYGDGMVAWLPPRPSRCKIYHIKKGLQKSWSVDTASSVALLGLSASIIAVVLDSGLCYVWKLSPSSGFPTGIRLSPSLLSHRVQTLVVSGPTLAVLYDTGDVSEVLITIWSLEGESVHHRVKLQRQISEALAMSPIVDIERKLLVDNALQSVVIFERVKDSRTEVICYTRFNLAAVVVAQGHLERGFDRGFICDIYDLVSPLTNGCTTMWSSFEKRVDLISSTIYAPATKMTRVIYDMNNERLRLEEDELPINNHQSRSRLFDGGNYVFKDVMFCQNPSGRRQVIDMKNEILKDAATGWGWGRGRQNSVLCGDETFLVEMSNAGFSVWCFDKNVAMANEDSNYKQ